MLRSLYEPYQEEKEAFGDKWCGPKMYPNWDWVLIAKFPKEDGGDGQSVNVFGCAGPARFYKLEVVSEPNSCGESQDAFEVTTGSGVSALAAQMAKAISGGMLGFKPANNSINSDRSQKAAAPGYA